MYKIGEDLEFWFGNVQIQLEPLESGNDLGDIKFSGWHSLTEHERWSHDINSERTDHVDWWAFLNPLKAAVQRLVIN